MLHNYDILRVGKILFYSILNILSNFYSQKIIIVKIKINMILWLNIGSIAEKL